jgi:hypothetical protein
MIAILAYFITMGTVPNETVVAGSLSDLMIVRHVRLTGSNQAIGRQLADLARRNHNVEPPAAVPVRQEAEREWAKVNYPEWFERAQGVARAFGVTDTTKEIMALAYNLDVKPGCSVVFYPGSHITNGHAMLSRNYDFPTGSYAEILGQPKPAKARSMTGDPYVLEIVPDKGFASLYIASYDLLIGCIDGINEKGLSVALLADDVSEKQAPQPGIGLNEISMTRFLLDRCATAKEARAALKDIAFSYSFTPCHYMIADASGDSFVWEISPDLKRRMAVDGKGKPQIVTNHLISDFGTDKLPEGNSFDRYRALQAEIAKRGQHTPEQASTNNLCVAVPTNPSHATLWHSVYDLEDRSMRVSFYLGIDSNGRARRTPYMKFQLQQ